MPPSAHSRGAVLVTGGAGAGIGSAIVRALAAQQRPVAIADRDLAAARTLCEEIGGDSQAYELDVRDPDSVTTVVAAAAEELGPLSGLVNSAGRGLIAPVAETSEADWDDLHAIDLRGVFLTVRACLPGMISAGDGAMVHIASVQAARPGAGYGAYAAAKGGLVSLSRAIAAENGPHGIRSNVVHPGLVDTPANRDLIATREDAEQYIAAFVRRQQMTPWPVGADEIADVVTFLLSPAARSITAAEITVDGGYSQLAEPYPSKDRR